MGKVNSFEVYDTLITRKVGLPKHIFILTGIKANELHSFDLDPEIFAEEREKSEMQLLEQGKIPNLEEIHQKLAINLNIDQALSNKLLELELDVEMDNSIPIPKNVNILKNLREKGEKITYISDMYLNARILRKLLSKHQIIANEEEIHVSCEYDVNKKSGSLFVKAIEKLNINKSNLHHFGNCITSDIDGAQIAGISNTYLAEGNLNRYEEKLCLGNINFPVSLEDRLYFSKMAACSRQVRLSNQEFDKQIYDVSASVAAPILFSFVAFVLQQSKGEVLYFLSRDGYILYNIAKKIMAIQGRDYQLRYLYISREVLVFEQLSEKPGKKLMESIKKIFWNLSLRQLLGKLSVSNRSIQLSHVSDSLLDEKLSNLKTKTLVSILHDVHIFSDVKKDAQKRKKVLYTYLENEGLFGEEKVSLVDVGWNLTIHDLLNDIFSKKKKPAPKGYYFGINQTRSYAGGGKRTGFLWDSRKESYKVRISKISTLIEVFCSAPHGQTVGYEEINGIVKPLFNNYEKKYLVNWGILEMKDAILNFSEKMAEQPYSINSSNLEKIVCTELIKIFWQRPTLEEIRAWGSYPFFINNEKDEIVTLYEQKPLPKTIYSLVRTEEFSNGHHNLWPIAHLYSHKPLQRNLIKVVKRGKKYLSLQFVNSLKKKLYSLSLRKKPLD